MAANASAIIPAGGIGRRMGLSQPKQFSQLGGIPVIVHTILKFQQTSLIDEIILVVPGDFIDLTTELVKQYHLNRVRRIIAGGKLRQDSVRAGLEHLSDTADCVLVHDGARPLVDPGLIEECIRQAYEYGAAMAAIPVRDTLKAVSSEKKILRTVDRKGLWQAQTPQAARLDLLEKAFAAAEQHGFVGTDEASLLEHIDTPVTVVEGSERNLKITCPEDLHIAEALLMDKEKSNDSMSNLRIGHGYDAHRLGAERPLVLGGVAIDHSQGLLGHSDADVLTHALCDAILGAISSGDIGLHFPDTDDRFKGISSLKLLDHVIEMAHAKGYRLVNGDLTIIAERPRLSPYYPQMLEYLAKSCRVQPAALNLKASTTEKMGFAGREEGIAAHAVVLLQYDPSLGR